MILNRHIHSKFSARCLSKYNLSYLQIKLPRGKFIYFYVIKQLTRTIFLNEHGYFFIIKLYYYLGDIKARQWSTTITLWHLWDIRGALAKGPWRGYSTVATSATWISVACRHIEAVWRLSCVSLLCMPFLSRTRGFGNPVGPTLPGSQSLPQWQLRQKPDITARVKPCPIWVIACPWSHRL